MLGRALRDIAALLGGRSIAAADFETLDPEIPLGLAARGDEPLVALVGDEQFELRGVMHDLVQREGSRARRALPSGRRQ